METSPAEPAVSEPVAPPRSTPSLARVIAGRATDLLAVGLVLMVGLTAGSQIAAWWRAEPDAHPSPTGIGGDELGDWDARAVDVTIGERGATLSRRIVTGDRSAAEEALSRLCSEVSARLTLNAEPRSEQEDAWLRRIETLPVAVEPRENGDAIYLLPAPLPQAVAVRPVASPSPTGADHRITATAWAFPYGEKRWLLYGTTFAGLSAGPVTGELALPPGARRIIGWRDANGAAVVAFEGAGSLTEWTGYYHRQAQFESQTVSNDSAVLRGQVRESHWDIQLQSTGDRVTGLCWCTPSADRPPSRTVSGARQPASASYP